MIVDGKSFRTLWLGKDNETVEIIDQTRLPFAFVILQLDSADKAAAAIRNMQVRGAPLIGATAAYGIALAMRDDPTDKNLSATSDLLMSTRPTAVNLRWADNRPIGLSTDRRCSEAGSGGRLRPLKASY